MAVTLYAANEGYLDDVEVNKVQAFEAALQSYMKSSQADLLDKINNDPQLSEENAAGLKAALDDFKANHSW